MQRTQAADCGGCDTILLDVGALETRATQPLSLIKRGAATYEKRQPISSCDNNAVSCFMIVSFSFLLFATQISSAVAQGSIADYAPTVNASCPQTPNSVLVRTFTPQTQALNPQEASYITARESNVIPSAWSVWVGNGSAIGYSFSLFNASLPRIGIALGGEGYRAAQFGAGVFSALDARNTTAKSSGTGGLLQVASYLAGSSGTSKHPGHYRAIS